jgi:hypothetical protein
MRIHQVSRAWAAIAVIPLASAALAPPAAAVTALAPRQVPAQARAATDTQPPTAPHLFRIAGLGGCELDMVIALSADESDQASAVRYQVRSNGAVIETVHASTTGSAPRFGNLDVFAGPLATAQAFTVVGVDSDGNQSAPSNAITRLVNPPC